MRHRDWENVCDRLPRNRPVLELLTMAIAIEVACGGIVWLLVYAIWRAIAK